MGKPSSTRLTQRDSQTSLTLSNDSSYNSEDKEDHQEMGKKRNKRRSIRKMNMQMEKKKWQRQTQEKIDKLKTEMLNEMNNASTSNLNSAHQDSIIILEDSKTRGNKRKISEVDLTTPNKSIKVDECNKLEPLIIPDDNELVINNGPCFSHTPRKNLNTAPIDCSTPIAKCRASTSQNNNIDTTENLNVDLTKEINRDSYVTIDLTTESRDGKGLSDSSSKFNTVIDLDNTENQDCTVVSVSNASLSMSGDSDVTVLHNPKRKKVQNMTQFVNGISKLNSSEKGKLLELITQKIFSGCDLPKKTSSKVSMFKHTTNQATETAEDTYIKEVILGEKHSRNSIGSNIYNPGNERNLQTGLRMIVIDGSNVAMEHGKGREFSVKGLKICIDYFVRRGHVVKAFVPRFRCKWGKSTQPRLLDAMERQGLVIYTPSREIQGKMVNSYDDRFIVQCAAEFDGVIVSGDNYRDLMAENPRWRFVIENRLLQFTWVNDMIMFPKDPLGRFGPTLEDFLKHPTRNVPNIFSNLGNVAL